MVTAKFKRTIRALKDDEILIPTILQTQSKGKFEPFSIEVTPPKARPYDGKFHPSTHSTWTARQLYLYLTDPGSLEVETLSSASVFAITRGHFWHEYFQSLLAQTPYLVESELPFYDKVFNRTGHMDGLLDVNGVRQGLEIKTINAMGLSKVSDQNWLKDNKYQYWCQAQEYLDVFGLDVMRFLFFNPEYPFEMREFKLNADPEHQQERRRVYAEALDTAAKDPGPLGLVTDLPQCCSPGSAQASSCPVRTACPIGRM